MRKRKLGKTEIEVSELGLGTWGLSGDGYGKVEEADQDAVIERALALGISLFETADCYARGGMETKLGKRLPSDSVVITKLGTDLEGSPPTKRFDAAFLRESLERSQQRLRRDSVDVVLLHNPSKKAMERGEAAETLAALVEEGKLRAWGISAGDAGVAQAALNGEHRPDVMQMAYNVFFSQDVSAIESDLEAYGVGFLARSVLAYGLLSGFWGRNRRFAREDHRYERWTPDQLERRLNELNALRSALSNNVPTLRAVALRFVLSNTLVSSAVLGPKTVLQLDQLVREAGSEPPYLDEPAKKRLRLRVSDVGALK